MSVRCDELITPDESTVVTESLPDAIVMEDGQCDGRLPDPTDTDESDWCEVFGQTDDLLDQLAASEARPWGRGRRFATCAASKYKMVDPLAVYIADLVCV